jgi:hypothetical protein
MLKGEVKVGKKPGVPAADIQDRPGKIIRMYVEEPDPEKPVQGGDGLQESGKPRGGERRPGTTGSAVGSQVLPDKTEFPDAPVKEPPAFIQNRGNRAGPQGPPDKGDGAKGTAVITALGDLDIRGTRQGQEGPVPHKGGICGPGRAAGIFDGTFRRREGSIGGIRGHGGTGGIGGHGANGGGVMRERSVFPKKTSASGRDAESSEP